PNGGPAGDLYVEIQVKAHPAFERHGDELHCEITLPMTAAALGSSITLDTLDGPQEIDVRAGTQPGEVLVLKGKGAGRLRGGGRGDLHVHLTVTVPTKLNDEQATLMRKLADLRNEPTTQVGVGDAEGSGLFSKLKGSFKSR
ncbi:MAG: DnaJ C-terminal domain-containing protein, partial [Candidatus Nanopelagicales bacterium]